MVAVRSRNQAVLRRSSGLGVGVGHRLRGDEGGEPAEPGIAPTANFSIAANSQLVAVLLAEF